MNDALRKAFEDDGYVIIRGALTAGDSKLLARLNDVFSQEIERHLSESDRAKGWIGTEYTGDGKYSPSEFITSLHEYGDEARAFIDNRVRSGDLSVLPARDPKYVSAMRETMLAAETDTCSSMFGRTELQMAHVKQQKCEGFEVNPCRACKSISNKQKTMLDANIFHQTKKQTRPNIELIGILGNVFW